MYAGLRRTAPCADSASVMGSILVSRDPFRSWHRDGPSPGVSGFMMATLLVLVVGPGPRLVPVTLGCKLTKSTLKIILFHP